MRFTADFETTTNPNHCRVWAYAIAGIENVDFFQYGNDITGFMGFCEMYSGTTDFVIYFHNLKFDGEFILNWLFRNGFTYVQDRRYLGKQSFTALIDRHKQFYSMEICFDVRGKHKEKVTLYDSLKILPFSVSTIAKGFNLPISKLEIDYHAERETGYELTPEEIAYIRNDVQIVAQALKVLFDRDLTAMTAGSNALRNYKQSIGSKVFDRLFPVLGYDDFIRKSYKGGFTYVPDTVKGKTINEGIVLDVNSLYPSVMLNEFMPYGEGKYYQGEYIPDEIYPLYVQKIRCQFEVKPNMIPTIQLKNNPRFVSTAYLETSGDIEEILTLTSVDLKLFLEHYTVYNLEYIEGYMFRQAKGLFAGFIEYWNNEKVTAKQAGNKAIYTLSKLMLNSLYGKFATNPDIQGSFPYMDISGIVKYALNPPETRKPIYIPIGTFITSYARAKTIRAAQSVYPRFLYADTDSLHLSGYDLPDLDIDTTKIGAWKHEYTFSKAKYLRQKCYIEYGKEPQEISEYYKITVAGMPASIHQYVNFDNFDFDTSFVERISPDEVDSRETIYLNSEDSKLKPVHVPGGIVLSNVDFTLNR